MAVAEAIDVRDVLQNRPSFGADEVRELERALVGGHTADIRQQLAELKSRADKGDASKRDLAALGITSYLVGRHEVACDYLSRVSGDGTAEFFHARALMALERFEEAAAMFEVAAKDGYDATHCTLCRAGAMRQLGRIEEAESILEKAPREKAQRAEYSYQMGCILADRGETYGAIEYFERAVDMEPHHTGALFRLASLNALLGNDDEAVKLYERALSRPPLYLGALLNLGQLYEDMENYSAAAFCFRRVLAEYPNHERARLFLKDIEASSDMYYDEEAVRRQRELDQIMQIPISDFELSARSRNCLERAGIYTLGDLACTTEQDLLGGKNFGETSLQEIREILETRGLRIGQFASQAPPSAPVYNAEELSPQERALIEAPVTDLNLSVRSRKCLARLGIVALGDLMSRSADELMAVRNFGVTSLNEIRAKLAEHGLKLRND